MDQEQLRKIVTEILYALEREGYLKEPSTEIVVSEKNAYVLCEINQEEAFLQFLRQNKVTGNISLTAILEDANDNLIDTLVQEQLCKTIAGTDAVPEQDIRLSIYPTVSRTSLCAAGLGMDNTFTSLWLRKDMEMGRKSVILVGGVEPFTGMEPEYYKELILSYIKNLMKMDVRFTKTTEDLMAVFDEIK